MNARRVAALFRPARRQPPAPLAVPTAADRVIPRKETPGRPPWDTDEAQEMREAYIAAGLRDAAGAGTLSIDTMRKIMAAAVTAQLAAEGGQDR